MCQLGFLGSVQVRAGAPVDVAHPSELAALRRVRDRLDRDYRQPLDVEALARVAGIPPRSLTRWFEIAYGRSPYSYLVARRAGSTATSLPYRTTSPGKEGC